ncbi:MAG: hypothetical protein KC590_03910 [Nitrospira sp.]|nr:hypothetical protein [Nitrospira sp.]
MGGFRDGPLLAPLLWYIPLLVLTCPSAGYSCDSQLNPLAFQVSTFTQNTLLPNGMMAIRYPETDQEIFPHVSVHRVLMVLPGLQDTLPESTDTHYRISRWMGLWGG